MRHVLTSNILPSAPITARLASSASLAHRRTRSTRLLGAAVFSAGAASFYLLASPVLLESPTTDNRAYSIKRTDTAEHPRNYRMAVSTPEQASKMLRANETCKKGIAGSGISSISFNQVASNSPIEDDHVEVQTQHGWSLFGIFDGHSGWTTSDRLKRELAPSIIQTIDSTPNAPAEAISKAFVALDQEIVYATAEQLLKQLDMPRPKAVEQLMPALSGSCALLASYDASCRALYVAVTGDSRAILGTRQANGAYSVKALSIDQTGSTPSEQERLRREHPQEIDTVVRNGRILGGLEPSRAFGDARYKWSADVQTKLAAQFFGRRAPANLKSPPYVTAKPEVTQTIIETEAFLVLGSDGLYEMLSNAEICELVAGWQTRQGAAATGPTATKSSWVPSFLQAQKTPAPQVIDLDKQNAALAAGQKTPGASKQVKKQFVYEDTNVATHIIRNALGAGNEDMLWGLLSLPYPLSRSYRDDISVTVVFFDGDASSTEPIKAKL
ncbi:phosphatase 2C-like domain-containing protein [Protomyces lactucae-debilis]|uniref:Phosphatase 2C-like domain-containing protein n=1 Tax=Protomyces lactucae-debilis TaxID=2754530 RepID=A0A1Y2FGS5_PROLT|nr:phosphatase 2C-like domain-containing protein [Protomyces lactucae-debilis]ORY83123.1 phosphatase 2C-like domain-containing protein [Protomyces lactucae-debilis]